MTHEEYCKLVESNEEIAQRKLFQDYFSYVYTIVHSRLSDNFSREDIEECISDIFADVYSSYDKDNRLTGDIKGFIGTVAKRRAIGYFNRNFVKNRISLSIDDEELRNIPSGENISDAAEKKELSRTLLKHIEALGEPDSTIIIEKYYFGRKSGEISEIVSLSPTAVRVRCMRALKKLRKTLSETELGGKYFYER